MQTVSVFVLTVVQVFVLTIMSLNALPCISRADSVGFGGETLPGSIVLSAAFRSSLSTRFAAGLSTHIPQMRRANFLSVVKNVSSKI
jgi:hypothetical protein